MRNLTHYVTSNCHICEGAARFVVTQHVDCHNNYNALSDSKQVKTAFFYQYSRIRRWDQSAVYLEID